MAKVASTINIEEMFWDEIKSYMSQNNISNRNTAIEYMLLERRTLLNDASSKPAPKREVAVKQVTSEIEDDDFLLDAIDSNFDSMS